MGTDTEIPTFGVEEEFLLVDSVAGHPVACNVAVAEAAAARGTKLQLEMTQCQVETATPVCNTAHEVDSYVRLSRKNAAGAAEDCGARLLAASVSPAVTADFPLTEKSRYTTIKSEFGIVANELAVSGCHVHVAIDDPEQAPAISNHLRPWMPTLLALSANSSICEGRDTGYASWRSILWSRWPSAGPPPYFADHDDYTATVHDLRIAGAALDDAMVYWHIRPSSHLPTIEIRVCDVPATVDETVLIAVLIRSLVMAALNRVRQGDNGPMVPDSFLRAACWRAARDGIVGQGVDVNAKRLTPVRECVDSLLRMVRPELDRTGEFDEATELVEQVFGRGNGAIRQRAALERRHDVGDVVAELARLTAL
ncbi:MAG: glutamate--cysteine ligase [Nocardiaceae bacterium]|nr:glutamate--cysteine ligase [Nocardiaceae bacterium]